MRSASWRASRSRGRWADLPGILRLPDGPAWDRDGIRARRAGVPQIPHGLSGADLHHIWANATVFSVDAGIVCCVSVGGIFAVDPHAADGLPLSWIAIPMGWCRCC